jgi:hypothetical protein
MCPSTNEWMSKMWYTHSGILFSYEKERDTTWVNFGKHARCNKPDKKDKYL